MTLSSPYFTHFGVREIHHVVPKFGARSQSAIAVTNRQRPPHGKTPMVLRARFQQNAATSILRGDIKKALSFVTVPS